MVPRQMTTAKMTPSPTRVEEAPLQVGTPSVVYETVRDLRQARGRRLGAMQRKFPRLGIVLLYILALLELAAFPLLGAGTAVGAPQSIFNVQGALFGGLCGATTLVLRIIQELWRTSGGAFNVDEVLTTMARGRVFCSRRVLIDVTPPNQVRGLAEELDARADVALALEQASAEPASSTNYDSDSDSSWEDSNRIGWRRKKR